MQETYRTWDCCPFATSASTCVAYKGRRQPVELQRNRRYLFRQGGTLFSC
jgi:hypothetical protein